MDNLKTQLRNQLLDYAMKSGSWNDMAINNVESALSSILSAVEKVVPKKKRIPSMCATDEQTLASVSYDRGHNACCQEMIKAIRGEEE